MELLISTTSIKYSKTRNVPLKLNVCFFQRPSGFRAISKPVGSASEMTSACPAAGVPCVACCDHPLLFFPPQYLLLATRLRTLHTAWKKSAQDCNSSQSPFCIPCHITLLQVCFNRLACTLIFDENGDLKVLFTMKMLLMWLVLVVTEDGFIVHLLKNCQ